MKNLFCVLLIVALILPSACFADDPDPITGAWYIMLDYSEYPQSPETNGKNYMFYILVFEESGTISGMSAESTVTTGLFGSASAVGTWSNVNGKYTVNLIGVGSNSAEFDNDRLLVQMTPNVWYSMQRMNKGDWYSDLVIRY